MTIDEAAQLVLYAGSLAGTGGTYVLEMGESLLIAEVVQRLAFVMGIPSDRVRIEYCGLRPGEKLDEELFFEDEDRRITGNPLVTRVCRPARPLNEVRSWLAELKEAAGTDPQATARSLTGIVASDCCGLSALGKPPATPADGDVPAEGLGHSVVREQASPSPVNVTV
jgi:FlaA1/EpsC-like NDP-sugar epimerase